MTTTKAFDRSLLIEGLGKGLRIIEQFSDDHPRLTATEAGTLAGLTRTAARRYLVSLVHYGYADTDGKHYWLLPAILRLGQSYLEAARLPRLVRPFLQRLSMQTGETANLSVLDGHEIVYLERSNSPRVVSIGFHPGARTPAHVVSPGFAILSTWPQGAARRLDRGARLQPLHRQHDHRCRRLPRHRGGHRASSATRSSTSTSTSAWAASPRRCSTATASASARSA